MAKYRKKITFEAVQWNGTREHAKRIGIKIMNVRGMPDIIAGAVDTPDGWSFINALDWLLTSEEGRSVEGRCEFEKTYEPVTPEAE